MLDSRKLETVEFSRVWDANHIVEDVATAIVEQSMDNVAGCSSARAVSRNLSVPYSTLQNILRKNLLQSAVVSYQQGEEIRPLHWHFWLKLKWPWQILWSDEAHFHLSGTVNTHNCRIWFIKNPRTFQEIPLQAPKVTCGVDSRPHSLFEKGTILSSFPWIGKDLLV